MSSFLDRLYSTLLETDEIKTADPAVREFLKYGTHGTHNIMTKGTFVTWLSLFVITFVIYIISVVSTDDDCVTKIKKLICIIPLNFALMLGTFIGIAALSGFMGARLRLPLILLLIFASVIMMILYFSFTFTISNDSTHFGTSIALSKIAQN